MKKQVLAILLCGAMLLPGCSKPTAIKEESSNLIIEKNTESTFVQEKEEVQAEEKVTAADFLKAILQKDAKTTEVSARQQLWQAGYTPAEIKEAIDSAFPKSQTEVKKEESSVVEESSKQDESSKTAENSEKQESSKAAEESKNESSVKEETAKQEQSSKPNQEASEGSNAAGSNAQAAEQSKAEETASAPETDNQPEQEQTAAAEQTTSEPQKTQSAPDQTESTKTEQSQAPAHVHTWVDVTEVVHHDAVTEQVWVVDQPAWDETVEKTEEQQVQKYECRCGSVFDTSDEWLAHTESFDWETAADYHDGWTATYETEEVVVGTETIHHDEVGHYETRTVTEAYDETVVTGQKCSKCGATK